MVADDVYDPSRMSQAQRGSRSVVLVLLPLLLDCGGSGSSAADGAAQDARPGTSDAGIDASSAPLADFHRIGRFDAADRFAWPGTAIAARFDGAQISVRLDDSGVDWFAVEIDGEAAPPFQATAGEQDYLLADGLSDGPHDLVLSRRTESFVGTSRFLGLSGARLIPTPAPARLVEFIGDSITCGYGVLGNGPSCEFSENDESEPDAWGAIAARALGAAHTAIAYSGRGVVRNVGGDTTDTMPVLFLRTIADEPDSEWDFATSPDVVVVNLGTNDFASGDPGTDFTDGYVAFIEQIREHYPEPWILVATSPMLSGAARPQLRAYLEAAVGAAGERVRLVDLDEQNPDDGYGCDSHPSRATQQKMADRLVPAIRDVTGW